MRTGLVTHYALYRRDGRVRAADASAVFAGAALDPPGRMTVAGREYVRADPMPHGMLFWDQLVDAAGRVAGFVFCVCTDPTLADSRLLCESVNARAECDGMVAVELTPGGPFEWQCVQAFGDTVYRAADDPAECVVVLQHWAGRLGFEVDAGVLTCP